MKRRGERVRTAGQGKKGGRAKGGEIAPSLIGRQMPLTAVCYEIKLLLFMKRTMHIIN